MNNQYQPPEPPPNPCPEPTGYGGDSQAVAEYQPELLEQNK